MAKSPMARLGATVALLFACFLGLDCDRPPPADSLRSWTAADHHSSDDDKVATGAQASRSPGPGGAAGAAGQARETAQLVELAWRQQCSSCHGPEGKGDGQMGPMLRAPDLTRSDLQEKAPDAEFAATIRNGKGKMPKFALPEPVVQGLVARIRASRGR